MKMMNIPMPRKKSSRISRWRARRGAALLSALPAEGVLLDAIDIIGCLDLTYYEAELLPLRGAGQLFSK